MANPVTTLDIPDIQVIVEFPHDANGFYWHHRILLKKISNGVWLALTPDLEISRHDLNQQNHVVLDRASNFPAPQAPYIYAFDPVSRATIESKRRTASAQAIVLGDGEAVEIAQMVWVIADRDNAKFGETIPNDVVDDPGNSAVFETKGVCVVDGTEVFIQRMLLTEVEAFKKGHSKDEQDMRLLGVHTDKVGKRRLELEDSLALMTEDNMEDFPLSGDSRAVKEFLTSVSEGPGTLSRYHTEWQRLSGIGDGSSINHSHRNLCEMLRLMHSYDQINIANLSSGEFAVRWLIQLEIATERNPRSPDFSGLDIIMGGTTTAEGKAITSKFTQDLTSKLKERATIYKQERLYREERRLLGRGGGDPPDASGKGKGKGKGKKGAGRGKDNSTGGKGDNPPAAAS